MYLTEIQVGYPYYLNVSVSVITSGPVPGELQDGVSTVLLPSDQEPILSWIYGRQGLLKSKAILQIHKIQWQLID